MLYFTEEPLDSIVHLARVSQSGSAAQGITLDFKAAPIKSS
jgi:hypothetical protein